MNLRDGSVADMRARIAELEARPVIDAAVTAAAGQILSGHRAVWVNRNKQAFYAANGDSTALVVVGVTLNAALIGDPVTVQSSGTVTEASWNWVTDATVWLGADGHLTQTVPATGALVKIGTPIAPNALHISPQVISTR